MADDAADKVSAEDVQNEETKVSPLPCSNDDRTTSVADFMKAPLASLGNWLDVMTNEEALVTELPVHGTKSVEQVINEPYEHRCSIVLGADMMYCQVPNSGPYNVIVFGIPETATEAEVYMLFGGSRSIETYLYRSDISEMLIKFREHRHVVSALLKQDMNFKEKPLRLGIVLINEQIDEFHRHNQKHHDFDMEMVPFSGAFDRSHVCEDDGQVTGLYDDIGSIAETESISPASHFSKVFNNDVRSSNSFGFYNCNTLPNIRNRKGSTASMQSLKSVPERSQRFYRHEEYNRPYSNNVLPPVLSQSEESNAIDGIKRTVSVSDAPLPSDIRSSTSLASSSVATKKSRINPFGDAKYVDQSKKMLQILEQKENEKQNKNFVAPFPVDFTQPPPNYQSSLVEPVQRPEINPKTIRIEKRPENVPPAALNGQVWVNKNILIPPSFRIPTMRTALQSQNNVATGSEAIDVTKPPPPVPQAYRSDKPEVRRIGRQFVNKSLSHGNNYHSSGSQYKNGQEYHHNRPYRNNHALPPTGPINRKKSSSMDQTSKSAADVVAEQKSQSAPLAQENVVHNSSGKSTPDNASKRPNSANSAMSFVTAESEVSSAELPGVPGSSDNIPEKINELTEEQRRHSWEGQKSPARKRERVPFKSRFDKKKDKQTTTSNASIRKSSDTFSRSSSRSTPQYQSASSVFLDANEEITPPEVQETKESTPVKEEPKKEIKAVTKARNCFDKRDRSLPLSRPHTASNDKTSNPLNVDSLKTETLSAPPTPSGSSKKRKDKAKGKVHQNLSNNKFRVLADNFEI